MIAAIQPPAPVATAELQVVYLLGLVRAKDRQIAALLAALDAKRDWVPPAAAPVRN